MDEGSQPHDGVTRRRFLGAAAASAGVWALHSGAGGVPMAWAEAGFDERVAALRSTFFTGPIRDRINLDSLDPAKRPDSTQLGTIGHFQFVTEFPWLTPENLLPYVVAAGIKWLRSGFLYEHWDWAANKPTGLLKRWVDADLAAGVKPLFTVNNEVNIGTPKEISGWVDMVRAVIGEWGENVGAFMFGNEPGNQVWKSFYGGDYSGGPWVAKYARFVEEGAAQIKADHPNVPLVNAVQVEQVAITQLKQSAPRIDALCMHHYTFRHSLPPEYNQRTADPKFPDFATSDPEFERTMRDYLRQGRMLLRNPELQLWMTEIGVPSRSDLTFEPDTLEPMSPTQQAKQVARMLVLGFLTATKTFLYALADPRWTTRPGGNDFGIVSDDLATPKPGYFVLGRISALTGGAATPDPEFVAVVTSVDGRALPTYLKVVPPHRTLVREQLRAEWLTTADGAGLVAIWSTHPPREQFEPRRATFAVNRALGRHPIVVDPMTGGSRFLRTHPGPGGLMRFELDVHDYPQFIVVDG